MLKMLITFNVEKSCFGNGKDGATCMPCIVLGVAPDDK